MLNDITRLTRMLRPHGWRIAGILGVSVVATGGWIILPLLVRTLITDASVAQGASLPLWRIAGLLAALVVVVLASYLTVYLNFEIANRVASDLRLRYVGHLLQVPLALHRETPGGELLDRLVTCATDVERFMSQVFLLAFGSLTIIVGSVAMMVAINAGLAVVLIASLPLFALTSRALMRSARQALRDSAAASAHSTAHANEILTGIEQVKAFNAGDEHRKRFAEGQGNLLSIQRRLALRSALLEPAVVGIALAMVLTTLVYGVWEMSAGTLNAGDLVAFLLYSSFLLPQARTFSTVSIGWEHFRNAMHRIDEVMRVPAERDAPGTTPFPERPAGLIEFRDVHFRYPGRPPLLNGFSLTVRSGETIGIVGETGAGKTTLLALLLRFYAPDAGSIAIDGTPVTHRTFASLRDAIALVPQDGMLFDGTIVENVRLGRPSATETMIARACVHAQVDTFIGSLPHGLRTLVGSRGVRLSGGERQRIAIARAFLRDAPILLLDEATASVDGHTERQLSEVIDRIAAGRTTIIVAHRLSTVVRLPRIVVLHDGMVRDDGTHDELLARCEEYRRLVSYQLIGPAPEPQVT